MPSIDALRSQVKNDYLADNHISKDVAMLIDRVDGVLFDSQPVPDNVLEGLSGLGAVRTLDIGRCSLTDSAMPHIAELSELN